MAAARAGEFCAVGLRGGWRVRLRARNRWLAMGRMTGGRGKTLRLVNATVGNLGYFHLGIAYKRSLYPLRHSSTSSGTALDGLVPELAVP